MREAPRCQEHPLSSTVIEPSGWIALSHAGTVAPALVGPKARTLGRLIAGGLPVPPGVVLTTDAWAAFVAHHDLAGALEAARSADRAELEAIGGDLTAAITAGELPPALRARLAEALAELPAPWAVRSSAPDEDGGQASAAGQFVSVLGAAGVDAVVDAVRRCWASAFAPAALAYRRDRGLDWDPARAMAVLIQAQVDAEAAGVLFSHAAGGSLLEVVPGPGSGLVDGSLDPERCPLPPHGPLPSLRAVGAAELEALRELGARVEALLGEPADIEWVAREGQVSIVQARPITVAAHAADRRVRWTAANTQEALLDPVTPLTWSLFEPLVERGRRDLFRAAGFEEIPADYMRIFHGLPYFNPDYFQRFLAQIPGAPVNVFDALIFGEGERSIAFRLPEFQLRTLRLIALYALARLLARERFELFLRWQGLRLRVLRRRDLSAISDDALVVLRRRATRLLEAALRQHVLGTAISGAGYLLLDLFLERSGAAAALDQGLLGRLTAGASGNALAVASTQLEEIAREAARHPRLAAALTTERAPLCWEELDQLGAEGRWFVRELSRFLGRHGHRGEKEAELSEPRWADDPSVLLSVLGSFVRAAQGEQGLRDQRAREQALTQQAQSVAERIRGWLRGRPLERLLPWRRFAFQALLREARRYAPYRENLKDRALQSTHLVRRCFLEAGRRLARRGVLQATDDAFYLEVDELEQALLGTRPGTDYAQRVAARRAERASFMGQEPPRYVIEVPGEPPRAVFVDDRIGGLLEGVGASAGKVTGTARLLRSPDDAARLGPGEIIVARVVNAGWTPLFHLAGGVVAEVGGALSHAAIVAREYGLPAVFGAAGATRIPDGATLCVDGDLGIVTVAE